MYINGLNAANYVANSEKLRYSTKPIETVKKDNVDGYAPVTANLWGAKTSSSPVSMADFTAYIPSFGASRATNNPDDLDPIEADTQSKFRLSSLDFPMICPDCGRPIMTKPIFTEIKEELANANEKTYLDVVESHKEFLFPQEENILKFLQEQKAKYPNKSISKIVRSERQKRIGQIEKQQYQVMDSIGKFSDTLPDDERKLVRTVLFATGDEIFKRNYDFEYQRYEFITKIGEMDIKDKAVKEKLLALAAKMPSAANDESAWFVKYGAYNKKTGEYRSSEEIAQKLLAPAYTNTDHVHPWNRGGLDAVSNFWLMHARCNIIKTDKPFSEWLDEDRDNRVGYIKQYLTDAQKAIDESDDPKMHPKYDLYSAKLAKTIYYETNGEVDFTEEFPLPDGYDVPMPAEEA